MFDDTATNDSGDEDKRIPTFCLIKGIPAEINFDEKSLQIALKKQTVGFRKCMMMTPSQVQEHRRVDDDDDDNTQNALLAKTYAIALFESKEAALDAAEPGKVQLVVLQNNNNSHQPVSLTVIPMLGDKALAPEATFKETITIDGEEVPKADLADSTGLSSALKSFAGFRETVALEKGPGGVAKWCKSTKKGQDCPFGNQCWFIHLKKFQKTIVPKQVVAPEQNKQQQQQQESGQRRDRRQNENDDDGDENDGTAHSSSSSLASYEQELSHVVVPKAACKAMMNLSGDWRLHGGRTIVVPRDVVESIFFQSDNNNTNKSNRKILHDLIQREIDAMASSSSSSSSSSMLFFVKFDIPHGSASDLRMGKNIKNFINFDQLYSGTDATPKPLRRDVLMHSSIKQTQSSLAVPNATEAVALLLKSAKATNALKKYLRHLDSGASLSSGIPIRIDFFQESLWAPPSQFSILIRTIEKSKNIQQQFMGAAQRIDWMIVDVANRRFENPPEVVAQQQLETEQLGIANDWRQISADGLKMILENVDFASLNSNKSNNNNDQNNNNNNYFCVNVGVLGEKTRNVHGNDGKYVRLDAATTSRPKILSIHDADERIRKSALLPFCGKSAASFKITWRIRTPLPEQVPPPIQEILNHFASKWE